MIIKTISGHCFLYITPGKIRKTMDAFTGYREVTLVWNAQREKCLYSEFFWSAFSRIWTECGEILSRSDGLNHIRCQIIVEKQLTRGVLTSRLPEISKNSRDFELQRSNFHNAGFPEYFENFSEHLFSITFLYCCLLLEQRQPNEVDAIYYSTDIIWTTTLKKTSVLSKRKVYIAWYKLRMDVLIFAAIAVTREVSYTVISAFRSKCTFYERNQSIFEKI